jgi:hypothetical protein
VSNPAMSFLAALYVINSILAHNVTPELSELDFIWFAHIPHNVSPCAFVLQPCSPIGCLPTGKQPASICAASNRCSCSLCSGSSASPLSLPLRFFAEAKAGGKKVRT